MDVYKKLSIKNEPQNNNYINIPLWHRLVQKAALPIDPATSKNAENSVMKVCSPTINK